MAGDKRVFSDEEFAVILRTASELANRTEQRSLAAGGLTLEEMKSVAAQAGFDPSLVEQAARTLATRTSETTFERLVGGPFRHEHVARFSVPLDEQDAARLLSAVRINNDYHSPDPGHASAQGMTWKASGAGDVLAVAARPDANGTAVSVVIDRRGTFFVVAGACSFAIFFTVLFATFALAAESPALGAAGLVVGIGGILAVARSFWASSTAKVRGRMNVVMEAVEQALSREQKETPAIRDQQP